MTILNQAEMEAELLTLFPDNITALISPADIRQGHQNIIDSLQGYPGVIDDGVALTNAITATPTKWTNFTTDVTTPNALLEANVANNRVLAKEPGLYFITYRQFGSWPFNEDLRAEIYVNGAPNPFTPISFAKEGQGAGDPSLVSVTDIAFIITSAMITAGGGSAAIELYYSSDTGPFNYDQDDVLMGVEYNPLSIRTTG